MKAAHAPKEPHSVEWATVPAIQIAPRPDRVFQQQSCPCTVCISRRRGWISKRTLMPPGATTRRRAELNAADERDPRVVAQQQLWLGEEWSG